MRDLPGAGQAWVVLAACIVDQVIIKILLNKIIQKSLLKNN